MYTSSRNDNEQLLVQSKPNNCGHWICALTRSIFHTNCFIRHRKYAFRLYSSDKLSCLHMKRLKRHFTIPSQMHLFVNSNNTPSILRLILSSVFISRLLLFLKSNSIYLPFAFHRRVYIASSSSSTILQSPIAHSLSLFRMVSFIIDI